MRFFAQQRPDTVELDACGRMKPAEETNAMETRRQDMLEKAADEFVWGQFGLLPLASAAVAIRPEEPTIGQEMEATISSGGLKDITTEIT